MTDTASQENLRLKVLRILEKNPHVSQREIAAELGVSLGGVNYCLRALKEKGSVKLGNFARSNKKLGYAYLLTPKGVKEKTEITQSFLARKLHEYEALKTEIEALKKELD